MRRGRWMEEGVADPKARHRRGKEWRRLLARPTSDERERDGRRRAGLEAREALFDKREYLSIYQSCSPLW